MSRRCNSEARGFTLLECEVALVVLGLVIFGLLRATSDHERLLSTLEGPDGASEQRWLRPVDDELARALGLPALLLSKEPVRPAPALSSDVDLEVLGVSRDLEARTSTAVIRRTGTP
ncbi:MAG: hypothetical protein DHS20C15_29030 [Planctomycetota bacterium]|nr:MAG: hypothetical protein DHS20C15_29030 [Planctomycetota bacterium]